MKKLLEGKKVAILVADGFEQSEMVEPRRALDHEGAETILISAVGGDVRGWQEDKWGDKFHVQTTLDLADPEDYDALLLPGGVMNPDKLRLIDKALVFIKYFFEHEKPVAAICHAPAVLIEADVVYKRKLTSYPSIRTDLKNAGAQWVDLEVVVDKNLVTSRKPSDIPAFNKRMMELIAAPKEDEAKLGARSKATAKK